jgi:hypothetical protein
MVELRSGTNTVGQNPSTPDGRDPNIPENIEITGQGDQTANQGAQMQDPRSTTGTITSCSTRSICRRNLPSNSGRAAQGTPSYRPPQFAFTTPPVRPSRPSQEEFKSTKSHEGGDGSSSSESTKSLPNQGGHLHLKLQ